MKNLHFIAPLWNVHGEMDQVGLMHGLKIRRRRARDVFRVIKQIDDLGEEHEQEFAGEPGTSPGNGEIFVVMGRTGRASGAVDLPATLDGLMEEWHWQSGFANHFEHQFGLMRLFKEGRIFSPGWYFYRLEDGEVVLESRSASVHRPEGDPYQLNASEARELSEFLRAYSVPFKHDYLELAFEYFLQSYELSNQRMMLLSLTIAAEVLFNDGHAELGYRLARGMATLLGSTEDQSWEVFRRVKRLYGKRSGLVHTGIAKGLTLPDIVSLRELVRGALKIILARGWDKDQLVEFVTASGFGKSSLCRD